jgi:hypothetical protein
VTVSEGLINVELESQTTEMLHQDIVTKCFPNLAEHKVTGSRGSEKLKLVKY